MTMKKRYPHSAFKTTNLAADSRLCNVKACRCTRKTSGFGNTIKNSELIPIHLLFKQSPHLVKIWLHQAVTAAGMGWMAALDVARFLQDEGVPLFHRHVRGLILTEQGELLMRTIREVFSDFAMAEAKLTDKTEGAQGTLFMYCTNGFGTTWLMPRLTHFLRKNPEILVSVNFSDDPLDVSICKSDVAITSSVMQDEGLIYHELICRPLYFYASRNYLLEFGVRIKPKDLDRHQLIAFSDRTLLPYDDANYILTCGSPSGVLREAHLSMNNLYGIAKMVETGSGIACLPIYLAAKFKDLVQVLP